MSDQPDAAFDAALADVASSSGLVEADEVEQCRAIQRRYAHDGVAKSLADIFTERNVATAAQLKMLVDTATKQTHAEVRTLGGYELIEKIADGGMGTVYKARQVALDRIVAVKILAKRLASDPEFSTRFFAEARAVARLDHQNIVRAVDFGESDGEYYFAMEFVEGQSLEDLVRERGTVPERECLHIAAQVARGLECAHAAGIVHRDIKPANILITPDGTAKISDLGLAKETESSKLTQLTRVGTFVGTPAYVAPEQAEGRLVDIRADIYSFGVVLYRMATGELPFKGDDAFAVTKARFEEQPHSVHELNPDASVELSAVVETMMSFDVDHRYPDPTVLLDDLNLVQEGEAPKFAIANADQRRRAETDARARQKTRVSGAVPALVRKRRMRRLMTAVGVTAAVMALVGAVAFMASTTPDAPLEDEASAFYRELTTSFEAGEFEDVIARLAEAGDVYAGTRVQPDLTSLRLKAKAAIDDARTQDLDREAAEFLRELNKLFGAERYEDVLKRVDAAGSKYDTSARAGNIATVRSDATAKIAQRRGLAEESAKRRQEHTSLVARAKEAFARENYSRATSLLEQASKIDKTAEVAKLLEEARRLWDRASFIHRGEDLEREKRYKAALLSYEKATALEADPDLAARIEEVKRLIRLTELADAADSFAEESDWRSAERKYREALEIAVGAERQELQAKVGRASREARYGSLIEQADGAVKESAWKMALSVAEKAIALKPDDARARKIADLARDAIGPEPEWKNSIGMQFVLIPGGEFTMGDPKGPGDEQPAHKVSLSTYYIGRYEVTNEQFEHLSPTHRGKWVQYSPSGDTPAVAVTWHEADAFCKWLSRKEGVEYRLPTEAEWEMAARGTYGLMFPWGNEMPDAAGRTRCNFAPGKKRDLWKVDGFEFLAPVGNFADGMSPHGCHDMAGNAWEWCLDWYAPYPSGGQETTDPVGPDKPTGKRVLRGGSFSNGPQSLRSANRAAKKPGYYDVNLGFRVVKVIEKRAPPAAAEGTQ